MKRTKFFEGQWFAVPLFRNKGYAVGIVSRGSSATKRGEFLGYYFGPRYLDVPTGQDTQKNSFENAILVCWTSDQSLITGEWKIIEDGKPFIKSEWPVPDFYKDDLIRKTMAKLITFDQDDPVFLFPISSTWCKLEDVNHLPEWAFAGTNNVRSRLTKKLVSLEDLWSK
jgi:hypothetical protein